MKLKGKWRDTPRLNRMTNPEILAEQGFPGQSVKKL